MTPNVRGFIRSDLCDMHEVWRDRPLRPAVRVRRSDTALNIGGFGIFRIHPISRPLGGRDYASFSRIVRLYDQAKFVAVSVTNIPNNKGAAVMGFRK